MLALPAVPSNSHFISTSTCCNRIFSDNCAVTSIIFDSYSTRCCCCGICAICNRIRCSIGCIYITSTIIDFEPSTMFSSTVDLLVLAPSLIT